MSYCPESVQFFIPSDTPTAVYTINFQGVTKDNGNSTWCYSVSVTGSPGLSHWVLGVFEACQDQLEEKLLSVSRNGLELEENTGYELGTSDGVFGIKFEIGTKAYESPVIYCITLRGIYETTSVDTAVKGGPTPAQRIEDAICGPSCEVKDSCFQAINNIIESIALQEAGLAHITNAEGEKIQKVLLLPNTSVEDLIAINKSVAEVLTKVSKLEMVLEFKLQETAAINCPDCLLMLEKYNNTKGKHRETNTERRGR